MTVVYALIRPGDDAIHYVGITGNPDRRGRGRDGILVPIRWNLTLREAEVQEKTLILSARDSGCVLSNISPGGQPGFLGRHHSAETRARMSKTRKGKMIFTPEHRAKISAAKTGRKLSEAHRAKLTGRVFSAEHRAKLSAWQTGRTMPAGQRAKIATALRAFQTRRILEDRQ